jgi:serine/threonine protein kinase
MTFSAGTMLGPYEIVSHLGAGGMGEVYRARDARLGRTVAIKVTRSDQAEDPQARLRFEREARAIAALNHPHICSVYDVGRFAADNFLVMEYLDGETLESRLGRGPLPLPELFAVAIGVGEALVAAHRAGIVHRDLKPSNVMLTRNGVKLLDFGIAKQALVTEPAPDGAGKTVTGSPTVSGSLIGTVPYMAPEQLEGAPVDRRTDLFAFGSVLFEMATGRRAFGGSSGASQVAAILADTRPRASDVDSRLPRALDRIISVCLARDPNDRWQDAADMVREIRWAEEDLGVHLASPPGRRAWILHGAWAAALAVVCALLGLQWWSTRQTGPPPNPRPVIVLMDSPLPGRVYDPRTAAEGGTNADDVTDALRVLPVAIRKENTSAVWHREEQVLLENPDLIVSHLSCLLDERVAKSDPAIAEHLLDVAEERLLLFFAYLAARNPRTHFIIYSRGQFARKGGEAAWLASREVQLPVLRGRLHPLTVPGGVQRATFREPATAELVRARVKEVLAQSIE